MPIDDGGPARDATLRDMFASQAMAAMLGCYRESFDLRERLDELGDPLPVNHYFKRDVAIDNGAGCAEIASDAYLFADAMIAARKESNAN